MDITLNPYAGSTDAVTEPLPIKVATFASGVRAERGISNKPAPLPLNTDAVTTPITLVSPTNFIEAGV